jgi:hypothetical protein
MKSVVPIIRLAHSANADHLRPDYKFQGASAHFDLTFGSPAGVIPFNKWQPAQLRMSGKYWPQYVS